MALSFAEMMYYAEADGLLPTRTGNINALIKDLRKKKRILKTDFFEMCSAHGVFNLTPEEAQEIIHKSGVRVIS